MPSGRYQAVCQYCGKVGTVVSGTFAGGQPATRPNVVGKCPCHPSGNPNMPHAPKWVLI